VLAEESFKKAKCKEIIGIQVYLEGRKDFAIGGFDSKTRHLGIPKSGPNTERENNQVIFANFEDRQRSPAYQF
jgi:hypothetical protein